MSQSRPRLSMSLTRNRSGGSSNLAASQAIGKVGLIFGRVFSCRKTVSETIQSSWKTSIKTSKFTCRESSSISMGFWILKDGEPLTAGDGISSNSHRGFKVSPSYLEFTTITTILGSQANPQFYLPTEKKFCY